MSFDESTELPSDDCKVNNNENFGLANKLSGDLSISMDSIQIFENFPFFGNENEGEENHIFSSVNIEIE